MADSPEPVLKDADYNMQFVLYFLSEMSAQNQQMVNLKTIVQGTGINYNALKDKIEKLQTLKLVYSTFKGKEKIVYITDEGKKALSEWQTSDAGQPMIADFKEKLGKRKKEGKKLIDFS